MYERRWKRVCKEGTVEKKWRGGEMSERVVGENGFGSVVGWVYA